MLKYLFTAIYLRRLLNATRPFFIGNLATALWLWRLLVLFIFFLYCIKLEKMTNEVKNIINIYEAGDEKNRHAAAVLLAALPFEYLREFCEYYAERLRKIVNCENLPFTAAYDLNFIKSDIQIIAENNPDFKDCFVIVYINENKAFCLNWSPVAGWSVILKCKRSELDLIPKKLL